jgi:hypothetical protein
MWELSSEWTKLGGKALRCLCTNTCSPIHNFYFQTLQSKTQIKNSSSPTAKGEKGANSGSKYYIIKPINQQKWNIEKDNILVDQHPDFSRPVLAMMFSPAKHNYKQLQRERKTKSLTSFLPIQWNTTT